MKNIFSLQYAPDFFISWQGKNHIKLLGSEKDAKRELWEKGGERKQISLKGSTQKYKGCCRGNAFKGIMSLCHHISTTRPQGN